MTIDETKPLKLTTTAGAPVPDNENAITARLSAT